MTYEIAIPSYQRASTLKARTLAMLQRSGIPASKVRVFVASEAERATYQRELSADSYNEIVVGAQGMNVVRNHITAFYDAGQALVEIDDDIRGVFAAPDGKLVERIDLDDIFRGAFALCRATGASLWGLYPVCNPGWMKPGHVSTELKPIIGTVWGRFVDKSLPLLQCAVKSDIERTLQHYVKDGKVLRFNGLAPKQNARTEPGGLQTSDGRTLEKSEAAAQFLLSMYPDLVSAGRRFAGGHAEVKLKDKRP